MGASTTTVSGTPVSTRVRDIGNTDMALSVSAPDFNCSIQDNDSFVATKLKTKATTGTATETYTNMTSVTNAGADLSTTLSDQSAVTTITEDTHYETLYWGIEVPATGVAGTCTTTVTIIGSPA